MVATPFTGRRKGLRVRRVRIGGGRGESDPDVEAEQRPFVRPARPQNCGTYNPAEPYPERNASPVPGDGLNSGGEYQSGFGKQKIFLFKSIGKMPSPGGYPLVIHNCR